MTHRIGVFGMAVMGQNLALNIAEKLKPHGQSVAVCNRSFEKTEHTVARAKAEGDLPLFGYKDVSSSCYVCLERKYPV
jgi:6-phosphogluconate dehydrogenase